MTNVLHNGIILPADWPPDETVPETPDNHPAYLSAPPAAIGIHAGRQLFVDDFLIERTDLKKNCHQAEYSPSNPVLQPETEWENDPAGHCAAVFNDGVWYDEADRQFKMWYMGGLFQSTCLALSNDGVSWSRPALDVVPGTNIVHRPSDWPIARDAVSIWRDSNEADPKARYKMLRTGRDYQSFLLAGYSSPDGIHWGDKIIEVGPGIPAECRYGDTDSIFYDPFRGKWVHSIRGFMAREHGKIERYRRYHESDDFIGAIDYWGRFGPDRSVIWQRVNREKDLVYPNAGEDSAHSTATDSFGIPAIYSLDAVAYESVMVAFYSILSGFCEDHVPGAVVGTKKNHICLGFSRDGFHFHRPTYQPFLSIGNFGDWNTGYLHAATGGCLVVGDKLHFYTRARQPGSSWPGDRRYVTGLATLRRDGFVSMDADETGGMLTTRVVRFNGRYLFVNVDCADGELQVEILDAHDRIIRPFSRANCTVIRADRTRKRVHWGEWSDLSSLSQRRVKFRFHLRKGALYAFWVSPDSSGASLGYVAAGGPGYRTAIDDRGGESS